MTPDKLSLTVIEIVLLYQVRSGYRLWVGLVCGSNVFILGWVGLGWVSGVEGWVGLG